jgi:hypothetical protein
MPRAAGGFCHRGNLRGGSTHARRTEDMRGFLGPETPSGLRCPRPRAHNGIHPMSLPRRPATNCASIRRSLATARRRPTRRGAVTERVCPAAAATLEALWTRRPAELRRARRECSRRVARAERVRRQDRQRKPRQRSRASASVAAFAWKRRIEVDQDVAVVTVEAVLLQAMAEGSVVDPEQGGRPLLHPVGARECRK